MVAVDNSKHFVIFKYNYDLYYTSVYVLHLFLYDEIFLFQRL